MISTDDAWICYNFSAVFNGTRSIWYVGCCPAALYSQLPDLNRNSIMIEKGEWLTDHQFTINCATVGETGARAMQAALSGSVYMNTDGHDMEPPKTTRRGNAQRIENTTTGDIYRSGADAASQLGVSESAIAKHLAGRSKTVTGCILVRKD